MGGASATAGSSGMGVGGGGTVPPGGACTVTKDCQGTGFFCNGTTKVCSCAADKPEICGEGAMAVCTMKASDPENCGTCGMACPGGAACSASACTAAPVELTKSTGCGSMRLLVKGTDLYWTEKMSGKVMTIPVAGGTAKEIAMGQASPTQLVADDTALYWVVEGAGTAGSSKVMKAALPIPATPVAPTALVTSADAVPFLAVAVAAGKLYYSHGNDILQVSAADGSEPIIVAKASNHDEVPPVPSGEPAGLAVAGNIVAWATATRNGVECDDILEGEAGYKELAESQGEMPLADFTISADGTKVFWSTSDQLKVAVTNPPGTGPMTKNQTLIAQTLNASPILSFAVNATDAYYAAETGLIFKHSNVPPAAGMDPTPPVSIARDQDNVSSFALDATKVYWATEDCAIHSVGL